MKIDGYKPRIIDAVIEEELEAMGAVLIEGAKSCGKTTTALNHAESVIFMDDPAQKTQYLEMAETHIDILLEGKTPKLIDEWQIAPGIWDAVRHTVDRRHQDGQFILTGSAVPSTEAKKKIFHSGAGRFAWLTMRPMTLWESGESSGEVSVRELFKEHPSIRGHNPHSLPDIAYLICRGGWPKAVDVRKHSTALRVAYNYYDAIVRADISRVDDVVRDQERTKRILRTYSRHIGTQVSLSTMLKDLNHHESQEFSDKTLYSYINALKSIFVIEDMQAWSPYLKSKTTLRTSDTRYFVDPSVGCAALGVGPEDLINDLKCMGLMFENLCVRDLRVYAQPLDGSVYHYRDRNGLECDAIIHLRNGKYGLIEIKLGGESAISEGVKNLKKFEGKLDVERMKSPSFMMVLTAVGDYAYRRKDGVIICPIGCLRD